MKRGILFILSIIMTFSGLNAQQLKVNLSPDNNKVNRDTRNGVATIVFESSIKALVIVNDDGDERVDLSNGQTLFLITPVSEEYIRELGHPTRRYLLRTPRTAEYLLETGEILPNTVTYYTVTMPNQFPLSLSAEYMFTKSSKYGIRLSFGKQFGGYVSYKWGQYKASGNNIADIHTDANLTNAEELGYIRQAITGGVRIGLFNKNIGKNYNGLYLLIGGGYGEYGRQWENPTQIVGNVYFYTDYMKGFNGEAAIQAMIYNWFTISAGADMLVSGGKVSVDYMIGVGLNFNFPQRKK